MGDCLAYLCMENLSDIHGNYIALQECMDYAINRGIHTFIFLGDYLGELAYPQKTMDILFAVKEKYSCYFIKGNKEDYWMNYKADGEKGWSEFDFTTGCLYYTYHHLKPRDMEFFQSLSDKEELEFDRLQPITICHGSPKRNNEKMVPGNEKTYALIEDDRNPYILCGHTHIQGKIEYNGRLVLNAGSVGVSLHGEGNAQFMILRGGRDAWDSEFISLNYDVEKVIADLYASGLVKKAPFWCKVTENLLRTGEISHQIVLSRAMALCTERYGECRWPGVPEECWKQAVEEMQGNPVI